MVFLRNLRLKIANASAERALKHQQDHQFPLDYASQHVRNWENWFAEFKNQPNVNYLEVGSMHGRSAVWFLETVLTHPSATASCVDPFEGPGFEPHFDHNLRKFGAKLAKHKGRSERELPRLPRNHYDIIYIDGAHQAANVLLDAHLCWPLLKNGGLLLFDDYLWRIEKPPAERPKMAIDLFLESHADRLILLHKRYQVLVRKKA